MKPIVPSKEAPRWLYEILRSLSQQTVESATGLEAITRGEAPDGSGAPLVDLSQFFFLPGRPSSIGQIGYGSTLPDGNLTFSSTSNSNKGFIYLGYPTIRVVLDEDAGFLGIGTSTPSGLLHINTAALGTSTIGGYGTVMQRFSYAGTTLFDIRPVLNNGGIVDVGIALATGSTGFVVNSNSGSEGLRFTAASARSFIQCGVLDGAGTPQNKNLTIGGINATAAADIIVNSVKTSFISPSQVGINTNLSDFGAGTGPGSALYVTSSGSNAVVIEFATGGSSDVIAVRTSATGVSPNKAISTNYIWRVTGEGRMWVSNASGSSWYTYAPSGAFYVLNGTTDLIYIAIAHGIASWSDSAVSEAVYLAPLTGTSAKRVWISADGNGLLDRFGVASKYNLISNARPGGAGFLAPATTPEVCQIVNVNSDTDGADGAIVLKIRTMRSGQTADLTQWLDSNATVKASVSPTGVFTGVSADIFYEDEIISYEDENVYYSTANP